MNKLFILVLLAFVGCTSNNTNQNQTATKTETVEKASKVIVYYFHGTRRCPTCISIEDNSKKTIDTYFKNELNDKQITFNIIDADDEKNKNLVEKYQISGSSLLLVKNVDGKEKVSDLTDFAFSYSKNQPDKFQSGLKDSILIAIKN